MPEFRYGKYMHKHIYIIYVCIYIYVCMIMYICISI